MRRYPRVVAPAPGLVDIGLNVAHKDLRADRVDLLQNAHDANVVACVCTGTSVKASHAVLEACRSYRGPMRLVATVGIHPHDAKTFEGDKTVDALRQLIVDNPGRAVAVGECGIDFDRMFSTRDQQVAAFAAQLRLARELDLPVFLHQRLGFDEFLRVMDEHWPPERAARAVVHCFTGTAAELETLVARGYRIGLTGLACDQRRCKSLRSALARGALPLDRLMLETDAPFCTPKCIANGPRRCEPEMVTHIALDLAQLMNVSVEQLCAATTRTALEFFAIKL